MNKYSKENYKRLEEYKEAAKESFELASEIASNLGTSPHLQGEATIILFDKLLPSFMWVVKER